MLLPTSWEVNSGRGNSVNLWESFGFGEVH